VCYRYVHLAPQIPIPYKVLERDEEAFFEETIAACRPRLLGRLRSCHGKSFRKAAKPAIISRLCEAVYLLNQHWTRPYGLASVQSQIASLDKDFKRLEALSLTDAHSEPGRQCLKIILCSIEQILASTNIKTLLNLIPKEISAWSGLAADSLARRLMCLAQYRYAARYLFRRARKDPKFRHLSIAEVPSGSFPASPHGSEPLSVATGLLSQDLEPGRIRRDGILQQLMAKTGKSKTDIETTIRSHTLTSKRVYAEIQLLCYYKASNTIVQSPRIICSNKHACLLCSLFIKVHGKFHVQSCHGRLYPRWRVPLLEDMLLTRMQQALDELNHLLESRIRRFLYQSRQIIADLSESIVFAPQACTVSTISTGSSIIPVSNKSNLERSLAGTPDRSTSHYSVSEYTSPSSTRLSTLRYLSHGDTIEARISSGLSIRIHTRRIHLEMTYEYVCALASCTSTTLVSTIKEPSKEASLLVQVGWIDEGSLDLHQHANHIFDLGLPILFQNLPDGILLSDLGLVLKKKDDIINLRVLHC
jgi:hypothetical protein